MKKNREKKLACETSFFKRFVRFVFKQNFSCHRAYNRLYVLRWNGWMKGVYGLKGDLHVKGQA